MGQLDVEQALAATKSRYPERDVLASSWLDAGMSYLHTNPTPTNPDYTSMPPSSSSSSSAAGGGGVGRL